MFTFLSDPAANLAMRGSLCIFLNQMELLFSQPYIHGWFVFFSSPSVLFNEASKN